MKKLLIALIFLTSSSAFAFEDCIVTTSGKLTDISIEDNTVLNVHPLITIMNEKNTLLVQPLKEGQTRFCVLKDGKDKVMFNVKIEQNKTVINDVEGFDILSIDEPPAEEEFELDSPPMLRGE